MEFLFFNQLIDDDVKIYNIRETEAANTDMFVTGSAIYGQHDYKKMTDHIRSEMAKALIYNN